MKQRKIADEDTSLPDKLHASYAQFEQNTTDMAMPTPTAPVTAVPSVTTSDVGSVFLGINPRKVTGPNCTQILVSGGALYSSLEHLDCKDTYVRLLANNNSSSSHTIILSSLISKLRDLGLGSILCEWILSSLTHRLQSVRI
eukprot:g44523.t1